MNLCSEGHEEVVYEGKICPACEIQKKLDAADEEIADLNDRINELKSERS